MLKNVIKTAVAVSALTAAGMASATVVYQAPENVVGGYCPTCAGTSTTMGDDISLAGGAATLTGMTWDTSNYGSDYDADIQVEFYNVDLSQGFPALGDLIFSQTSTHFLAGGEGGPVRTFVDIMLPSVDVSERFIYTISVLNNNGGTNWNMAGQLTNSEQSEDESLAQAQIGSNNEFDFIFGDWVSEFGADINTLEVQRLDMASYQLGLQQYSDTYGVYSNVTPNVTFTAADIPEPAMWMTFGLGLAGLFAQRRRS
ncbi:PEP-CTERM sorting domain-containing protein [Lacimicrobium sp. SS2-24]|uniref:PEP-CTERM sorting domain-containing protein n=1 Tax=Lacimicrobium sp. SS2-24 TaxID=2005569 RepID=UPI000B4A9051|nr:PEP-CTERM sorting domain-containing protein [Lacimicrobium sp. SS2-24]